MSSFLPSLDPLGGWCLHACNKQRQPLPTRWEGARCTDYAVTNFARQDVHVSVSLSSLKYGDHILLDLSCTLATARKLMASWPPETCESLR